MQNKTYKVYIIMNAPTESSSNSEESVSRALDKNWLTWWWWSTLLVEVSLSANHTTVLCSQAQPMLHISFFFFEGDGVIPDETP